MMGPTVMAGLTPDTNVVGLDPSDIVSPVTGDSRHPLVGLASSAAVPGVPISFITDTVASISQTGLASFRLASTQAADASTPLYLRHDSARVDAIPLADIFGPLSATFRFLTPTEPLGPDGVIKVSNQNPFNKPPPLTPVAVSDLKDGMLVVLETAQWPGRVLRVNEQVS